MNVLTMARMEWRGRRLLWLGTAFAAVACQVVPWLVAPQGLRVIDARISLALVVSIALAWILGVRFGAGMVARDLRGGTLGFLFAQPLRPAEVLLGRLLGSYALCVGIALAVLLPAMAVAGEVRVAFLGDILGWPLLLCLLGAHAASVAFGSRSPWMLLDLALLGATAVGTLKWGMWMISFGAISLEGLIRLLGWTLVLVLFIASLLQVERGRVDRLRSHRVLSLGVLGLAIPLALAGFAWAHRAAHPPRTAFRGPTWMQPAPEGPWVALGGSKEGSGLLNLETGRGLRFTPSGNAPIHAFSADGRRVVWVAERLPFGSELWTARLGQGPTELHDLGLGFWGGMSRMSFALSPSGRRVVLRVPEGFQVVDLESGRQDFIATPEIRNFFQNQVAFVSEDRVRCWSQPKANEGGVAIHEVDLSTRMVTPTGFMPRVQVWALQSLGIPDGRLAVKEENQGGAEIWLADGRTGQRLGTVVPSVPGRYARVQPLPDGGLLVLFVRKETRLQSFCRFDGTGRELWQRDVPDGLRVDLHGAVVCGPEQIQVAGPTGDCLNLNLGTGAMTPSTRTGRWIPLVGGGLMASSLLQGPAARLRLSSEGIPTLEGSPAGAP
ncbi:MAG TPA: hypothetical protein VJ623_01150 [Holophagaceae bacterium]|nr:hypothetical protein [Holophagaceae bacterium]